MLVHRRERIILLSFLVPALVLLVGFLLVPALWAVYLSFTDRSLTGPQARHPDFIGLDNYVTLFQDSSFYQSLLLTLRFVFLSALVGQFVLGLSAALLLNRKGQ
jgi:multiple sugar transport system permease protein